MYLELQADRKTRVKFWILKSWRVQLELLNLEGVDKVLKHKKKYNMIIVLIKLSEMQFSLEIRGV